MSACRNCYATIAFVQLDSGSTIPVNPVPDRTGTVLAQRVGKKLSGWVESREKPARPGFRRYRAHKADCHTEDERPRVARAETPAPLFD